MVAGYEGLYTGQADYSFGAQRIASLKYKMFFYN
ncbi:hypothetical protein J582_4288, partial [Acinetobacter sp. 1566109]